MTSGYQGNGWDLKEARQLFYMQVLLEIVKLDLYVVDGGYGSWNSLEFSLLNNEVLIEIYSDSFFGLSILHGRLNSPPRGRY